MATNLTDIIKKVRTALRGEEVRGSIADGLEYCGQISENAKADMEASAAATKEQLSKDIDAKAAAALKSIPESYTELDGSVKQLEEDLDTASKNIGSKFYLVKIDSSGHSELNVSLKKGIAYKFFIESPPPTSINLFKNPDYSTGYLGDDHRFTSNRNTFIYAPDEDIELLYAYNSKANSTYTICVSEISKDGKIYMYDFKRYSGEIDDTKRLRRAIDICKKLESPCTLVMEPTRYFLTESLSLNKMISVDGQDCCLFASLPTMQGPLLIYKNESNTDGYSPVVYRIRFDGGNCKHKIDGLQVMLSGTRVYNCRFNNFRIGLLVDAILDSRDCGIYDNLIGYKINYTESSVFNLHGQSKIGIDLSGEGNRLSLCKLHGDGPKSNSNCGIYITGSRNIIESCYFDQWKVAGIIMDSSKVSFLESNIKNIGGPYQNVIVGNYFYNNGSGEFDDSLTSNPSYSEYIYASAGIVLKTVSKGTGKSSIEENLITNNVFGSGHFKGWNEEGTTKIATKVGIHLCGFKENSIIDNVISLNKFENNIETKILYYNVNEKDNAVQMNF